MPVLSVAAGACVVEKHVLVKREDGGADARFSLEPSELVEMVRRIRLAERALGTVAYGPQSKAERDNTQYRRSIFVAKDMKKGETFTVENIRVIRPAHGLAPKYLDEVLGKKAAQDVEAATPLAWDMVER
jgi:sialic acid synthase SpsE